MMALIKGAIFGPNRRAQVVGQSYEGTVSGLRYAHVRAKGNKQEEKKKYK